MAQECWKDVVGYEGLYQVSDMGHIKKPTATSFKAATLRKDDGYYVVTLYKNNKGSTKYIHRIVLEAFVGPCPEGMECRHLNGEQKHNMLSNLTWGTYCENAQDTVKHGNHFQPDCRGSKHGESKLTEDDIPKIMNFLSKRITQKEIAKQFGVSQVLISRIKLRKSWRHVDV